MSLRTRLHLGLALLVLVAVGSATWAVGELAQHRVAAALSGRALELALPILAVLEEARTIEEAAGRAARLLRRGVAQEIVVADAVGKPLSAGIFDPRLVAAVRGSPFVFHNGERAYVYAALRHSGGVLGVVRITAGSEDPARLWSDLAPLAWLVALVDIGLIILFGALFLRRVIDPLGRLSEAAGRVAGGDFDLPPPQAHPADDELGRLITAFYGMTRSLREQRDQVVAQAKLATVGRLAAGVAHEIGNPLSAIVGYLAMVRTDLERASADEATINMLDRAQKETERMRALILELVDYARPIPPKQESIDLGVLVRATIELVRLQARLRGVTFEVSSGSIPSVLGDSTRLQQVLVNLFFNAGDALGNQGRIHVYTEAQGAEVVLFVKDDGPGVPKEHRGFVFDPFFSTKSPGEGTGLGLAVSRSIVEALGGKLELVDSERGAVFAIRLRIPT